tara:strand:- start:222 stop:356 length:135 start_codon:yes stop_codon:yes gene_type:complete
MVVRGYKKAFIPLRDGREKGDEGMVIVGVEDITGCLENGIEEFG